MTDLLDVSLTAHDAGLCVLPVAADGTKRPAGPWKAAQVERPSRERRAYFTGLALKSSKARRKRSAA